MHESAGHLGIFVSGSVAKKEHDEFASNIDFIEILAARTIRGGYDAEAVNGSDTADLVTGDYLVRFETRTLDDIRALGANSEEDERRFRDGGARLRDQSRSLPHLHAALDLPLGQRRRSPIWSRKLHPLRLQYELFSTANPFMGYLASMAQVVSRNTGSRSPKTTSSRKRRQSASKWIETSLNNYRDMRDELTEAAFLNVYGSPALQALVGLKAGEGAPRRRPGLDATYNGLRCPTHGGIEAEYWLKGDRARPPFGQLLYIRLPDGVADERGFRLLQRLRDETGSGLTLAAFNKVVRDQFFSLLFDERRAVEAIPAMLARDPELASRMASSLARLIEVVGVEVFGRQSAAA